MPAEPREHYQIAWAYLGTVGVDGIWPHLPKSRVFDPGAPARPEGHTRRSIAMELVVGGTPRYVLYTIDMGPSLRGLKAECLVLDPGQTVDTNKVQFMANFGRNDCHLDLPEIRYRVRELGADLLGECEAALRDLLTLAMADPERFVRTLHAPTSTGGSTLSVWTVSGGHFGSKRSR